ncbi:hypothetical protein HK100_006273 [Physocladia obscura]|uniref:Uncharacterized protein n=1 Tax=Physocladia obscura TaxID=109957 RepID=A0AAD5SRN1_9FUNG|nr:hypothetical protein HK100_006273 [Physocladia obscura]
MHAAGSKRKHEHEKPDRKTEHSGNGNGRNNERIDNDNSDSGDNESSGSSTGSTNNNNNAKDKRIDITVKSGNIGESPYSKRVLVSESPMKVDPAPAQQATAKIRSIITVFPRAATSMFGGETALTTWEDVADGTNTKEQSSKSTASENTIQSTPSVYKSAALTVFGSSSVHVFGTGTSTANTSFASLASNKSSSFSSIVASTATENVNMNEKPKTVENESNPFGSVAFGDAGRSKFPFSSSSFGSFASIAKSNSDATNNSGKTNPTDTIIGGDKNNDNDNNESNNAGQKLSDSPVTIFVLKEDASKLSDHKASSITEPPAPAASTFNSTPFNSFTSSVSFGGSFAGRETVETAVGSDALKSVSLKEIKGN